MKLLLLDVIIWWSFLNVDIAIVAAVVTIATDVIVTVASAPIVAALASIVVCVAVVVLVIVLVLIIIWKCINGSQFRRCSEVPLYVIDLVFSYTRS